MFQNQEESKTHGSLNEILPAKRWWQTAAGGVRLSYKTKLLLAGNHSIVRTNGAKFVNTITAAKLIHVD